MIQKIIEQLKNKQDLTQAQAKEVMNMIMSGELSDDEIIDFLLTIKEKGETIDEITGFVEIMREKADKIDLSGYDVVDTCGTGGDGKSTFNISTAAAIVAASCGVRVAKHGNRAASSNSGSADLLKSLGYDIDATKERIREDIIGKNMCFMFAPRYHSSMKHVVNARKTLKVRTVFNILGPLSNPANAAYQLIGVYDQSLTEKMAEVLGKLGIKRVFVVAADDGLDEVSLMSKTKITEYADEKIQTFMFDPTEYGFQFCKLEDLQVQDTQESKEAVLSILKGEKGPKRDIVVLNTAFILLVSGQADDIKQGIELAEAAIDTGKAYAKLQELVSSEKFLVSDK